MSWLKLYWGWSGRLNRLQLLLGSWSLAIPATILMMLLVPVVAPPAPNGGYVATNEVWAIVILTQAVPAPFQISMLVRRTHDLGVSAYFLLIFPGALFLWTCVTWINPSLDDGWIEVLVVLPLAMGMIALTLARGQTGENRYGPPPRAGWLP